MTLKQTFLAFFFLTLSLTATAQFEDKLVPPSEGKSVIYFIRSSNLGSLMNIRYFDEEKYLGKFNGRSYIRYECDPGNHIFWIKAENVNVLRANLEEGRTYLVETNAAFGAFSAAAKFKLVDYTDERQLKRINWVFDKREESTFTAEELEQGIYDNRFIIKRGLGKAMKKLKKPKKHLVLSADMYVNLD